MFLHPQAVFTAADHIHGAAQTEEQAHIEHPDPCVVGDSGIRGEEPHELRREKIQHDSRKLCSGETASMVVRYTARTLLMFLAP